MGEIGFDEGGTAAAYAYSTQSSRSGGRPGIEAAPSDEHLGDPQLISATSAPSGSSSRPGRKDASRNHQLPPRYEHAYKSDNNNDMRHVQAPKVPGRSPKGVADAHRKLPRGANTNNTDTSAPLDSTEADLDALKSRTLLQAFGRMKRDERLRLATTIGNANAGGDTGGGESMEDDHHARPDGRRHHRRPDPEGETSLSLDEAEEGRSSQPRHKHNHAEEESYDNDASSSSQRMPRGSNNNNADDDLGNDRNRQADATVQSIERTLAELRTRRKTRQQQIDDDGIQTAVAGRTSSTRTAANTAPVSDNDVANANRTNNRPRRREKEPSPSPSGRYGATSPVPPDDGLDLDHHPDRDVSSGNDTAHPNSTGGDFTSNRMRGNGQEVRSRREKPIDRMLAKHAVVQPGSSPPQFAGKAPTSPTRSVRFEDEHQSEVSTLPSLGTDGYTEDDATMDDDHYFRQGNSPQRTPRSPSPLTEFLQVKKQLASMPKAITTSTHEASGEISRSAEQPVYRNRRAETQNLQIDVGGTEDNDRAMNAKKNDEDHPSPILNASEEEAAMDEYVKQLRARSPQVGKTRGIASATSTPKRDMRKEGNRQKDIQPPSAPATPIGANITVGATNHEEDTSLLSGGISTMEKQIAEITSRERSATYPSHSSSSSSTESSSSQIAECVRDISPPPTPIRVVRKRERLERTRGLQRKDYEEDTIFDSLSSAVDNRDADGSVATEDDNGLLHFMATLSVPSTFPFASSRDDDQPMKDDFVKPNKPRAKATLNEGRPADVSGNQRQRVGSVPSDSSSTSKSQSTTGAQSISNEGLNHDINNRHSASTKPASIRMKGSQEKLSADERSSRDQQWVDRRTKSGHSSFSRGDFSTPSDEHHEFRRDEIGFSGAVSGDTTTNRSPGDGYKATVSENNDLDSLNDIAAKHVEVSRS